MRNRRYFVLGLWIVVYFLYLSLAGQWIAYSSDDKEFSQYVEHVVQVSAVDHRPAKDVRTLLIVKAEQLSIPLENALIDVTGEGETLRTVISYDTEIRIPGLNRVVYRMEFSHDLNRKTPR